MTKQLQRYCAATALYILVLFTPIYHMLGGSAAANTGIGKLFFFKRNTAGFYTAGFILDFILTSAVAAPHRFNKAAFLCGIVE